ncbi:MAG: phosphoribosylformylglycinamidine synthase subunit PurL [Planctomycetota bacterium]
MQAWRVEVRIAKPHADPAGDAALRALSAAGADGVAEVRSVRGYLLEASLPRANVEAFAREVLADPIVDELDLLEPGEDRPPTGEGVHRLFVVPRPGVTDPVAKSVQKALADMDLPAVACATFRGFLVAGGGAEALLAAARKVLSNDVIQTVLLDRPPEGIADEAPPAGGSVARIRLAGLSDEDLERLSADGGLALDALEMRAIQGHFDGLGRDPTRMEIEMLAQTWSEHCKHKTLTGEIEFDGRRIDNLLKSTIARVTRTLDRDFCVSVFEDNAGVIRFDDEDSVCIKVETHNRPSAIEPFGGAGTGVGGVIRDVLGTGLGARPIASTDVFCFAPPTLPPGDLPRGCLHPLALLRGVVAGVRDYGNPMGIPTVNGSVHFDEGFVGNPLVFVGNVGVLKTSRAHKAPRAGDLIVALGGRTGRDGIHGATFSSLDLHSDSERVSSGAVQIGDPITERKVMDAVLRAADENLFTAITDCGAGGFSSAVGEMADGLGAEVELKDVPLKYAGLEPWEIWISEAQERMVLSVPPGNLERLLAICADESCETVVLGSFVDSGRIRVRYGGVLHADLDLSFLHRGLPRRTLRATYSPFASEEPDLPPEQDLAGALLLALSDPDVASKEWIIRQYDHEVQAGSAGKPLCGPRRDGPSDAAVLCPKPGSPRGIVLANGLVPRYSRIDPAAMAECALDEAMRNAVAAGADPEYTAILDNYCWSNVRDPRRLGELVRASLALADLAEHYRTPFVSGKDSLNNEFRAEDRTIAIPGCILVTALSVVADVRRTLGSDLSRPGSLLVLVGVTKPELGGSVYYRLKRRLGSSVPRVDKELGRNVLRGVHRAIASGAVLSAHDCSEGGLAVASAEMAIAGRLGARIDVSAVAASSSMRPEQILFSESQSRILLEVPKERLSDVEANLGPAPFAVVGEVLRDPVIEFRSAGDVLARVDLARAVRAFKEPLDLDGTLAGEERP